MAMPPATLVRALLRRTRSITSLDVDARGRPPRVVLPFATDIPIRSYLDYAFPLSIVAADPHHREALFGSFIQLFFPDDKLTYDRVLMLPSLRTADWARFGLIETEVIDTHASALRRPEALVDLLIDRLRQGWYAEIHLDEYFLPGRPSHLTVHSVHDNLILGYDVTERIFGLAGYGRDYEIAPIDMADICRAFYCMPRSQLRRRRLRLIRRTASRPIALDRAAIAAQLGDYLASRPTMSAEEMRQAQLYWKARRFTGRWGLAAYSAFHTYIASIGREGQELDLRVTRTWWEHKACMLARLRHLESARAFGAAGPFASAYARVEELARAVRFEAYEYNTCGRHRRHLEAMADALADMREADARVLGEVWRSLQ